MNGSATIPYDSGDIVRINGPKGETVQKQVDHYGWHLAVSGYDLGSLMVECQVIGRQPPLMIVIHQDFVIRMETNE